MKKLLVLIVLSLSTSAFATFTDLEKVEVNSAESKLVWVGKKVTGEHTGEIKLSKGHLNFKSDALIAGEFEIDMSTITDNDITDKEYHTKFINHINSPDFFDTAKFKTATIKITNATKAKDGTYKIVADLTIKGVTKPITFTATATKEKAEATIVFDRTNYGIKFKSGKYDPGLGDKLIYDDVQLKVALVGMPVNKPVPTDAKTVKKSKNKK
jgi:polyisoprenoid-binding protein YceI